MRDNLKKELDAVKNSRTQYAQQLDTLSKQLSQEDNIDWDRDWSDPSTMPGVGVVGEIYDKLRVKHPGWNDVLHKASKAPRSRVKPV